MILQVLIGTLLVLSVSFTFKTNYNYSQVHQLALENDPLPLPFQPLPNSKSSAASSLLLELHDLKKYNMRDTNYRAEHPMAPVDNQLINYMEPP